MTTNIEKLRELHAAAPDMIGLYTAKPMSLSSEAPLPECDRFYETVHECLPDLLAELDKLRTRQQEHLALIARITNEVPLPDEVANWPAQRASMIAEIGTLRSEVDELHRQLEKAQRELAAVRLM